VRLDHLLSKEHGDALPVRGGGWLLVGCGTASRSAILVTVGPLVLAALRGCRGRRGAGGVWGGALGTLLGPEGTPAPLCGDGVVSDSPGFSGGIPRAVAVCAVAGWFGVRWWRGWRVVV
jgi:hypothetical protein